MNDGVAFYFDRLVGGLVEGAVPQGSQEHRKIIALVLKVMALMSAADGIVKDVEVRLKRELCKAETGKLVEAQTLREATQAVVDASEQVWREIVIARHYSDEIREDLFRAAHRMAIVDRELHVNELALLKKLGLTLGFTDHRIEGLFLAGP